jgi:hypothetical protein
MRALSVKQPWASLIALGEKTIECRSWSTRYRGPLLIHASGPDVDLGDGDWARAGLAVSVVRLVDVRPLVKSDIEAACIGEFCGGYAWVLEDAQEIEPIPLKGRPGLWEADVTPRLLTA